MSTIYLLFFIFAVPSCFSVSRWSNNPDQPPPQLQFDKERKVFLLQSKEVTLLSIFNKVLGGDFYDKIAHETSIYSCRNPSCSNKQSNMKEWYNVNGDEIKKFFGKLIIMGNTHNLLLIYIGQKNLCTIIPFLV